MRNEFPGYFKLSEEEVEVIWKSGLIVFDTNALLNLYRYTESTRVDLLSAIRSFSERVRIPYQVASEFFRNRVTVISEQRKAYADVLKAIGEAKQKVTQAISKHDRHNGLFDAKLLKDRLATCLQPLLDEVTGLQDAHPDLLGGEDPILGELCQLLEGRVLPPKSASDQEADRDWALARIAAGTPPGTKDADKEDGGIGDALIWREIIALAKSEKRPVIFVSDDQKADWVQEVEGKKTGALPALRQELLTGAGQDFQHYTVQRFLQFYKKTDKPEVSEASIEEAATVRNEVNRLEAKGKTVAKSAAELLTMPAPNVTFFQSRKWADYEARMREAQITAEKLTTLQHDIRRYERALGQTSDQNEIRVLEAAIESAEKHRQELQRHELIFFRTYPTDDNEDA